LADSIAVLRLYDEIQSLDPDYADNLSASDVTSNLQELDRINHAVAGISVPRTYKSDLYKLRRDIDLVRRRLQSVTPSQQDG
jgi:hypothetical protein